MVRGSVEEHSKGTAWSVKSKGEQGVGAAAEHVAEDLVPTLKAIRRLDCK